MLERAGTRLHWPAGPMGVDEGQMTGALFLSLLTQLIDVGRREDARENGCQPARGDVSQPNYNWTLDLGTKYRFYKIGTS